MKNLVIYIALFFSFANSSFASSIKKIPLSELYLKAEIILLAEVKDVVKTDNQDRITIEIAESLKGYYQEKFCTFDLITAGELKDFDPVLQPGDTGVFFLKQNDTNSQCKKAYWGSIATFSKNNFFLSHQTSGNYEEMLETWRSYRSQRGEIKNIEDYEKGFHKGFTDPPGLVDGSSDYNLGHSDGMLARNNKLPDE